MAVHLTGRRPRSRPCLGRGSSTSSLLRVTLLTSKAWPQPSLPTFAPHERQMLPCWRISANIRHRLQPSARGCDESRRGFTTLQAGGLLVKQHGGDAGGRTPSMPPVCAIESDIEAVANAAAMMDATAGRRSVTSTRSTSLSSAMSCGIALSAARITRISSVAERCASAPNAFTAAAFASSLSPGHVQAGGESRSFAEFDIAFFILSGACGSRGRRAKSAEFHLRQHRNTIIASVDDARRSGEADSR